MELVDGLTTHKKGSAECVHACASVLEDPYLIDPN